MLLTIVNCLNVLTGTVTAAAPTAAAVTAVSTVQPSSAAAAGHTTTTPASSAAAGASSAPASLPSRRQAARLGKGTALRRWHHFLY